MEQHVAGDNRERSLPVRGAWVAAVRSGCEGRDVRNRAVVPLARALKPNMCALLVNCSVRLISASLDLIVYKKPQEVGVEAIRVKERLQGRRRYPSVTHPPALSPVTHSQSKHSGQKITQRPLAEIPFRAAGNRSESTKRLRGVMTSSRYIFCRSSQIYCHCSA